MEWEILKGRSENRHYINNEVLGIVCITGMKRNSDAINIVIEKLENQPLIPLIEDDTTKKNSENIGSLGDKLEVENKPELVFFQSEAIGVVKSGVDEQKEKETQNSLTLDCYWIDDKWIQPPVRIKHGDLVEITADGYFSTMTGRYIGKGYGIVELYDYSKGVTNVIGKVVSRGIDHNPRLILSGSPWQKIYQKIEN